MDSAANATKPGGFWKRLKPLLPSSGPDNSDETCIIDDGVVVNEPSNLFNEYFSTPALSQDALDLSLEQPRSQGLSSYHPLERARRDPGRVWSRASQNLGGDN